MVYDLRLDGPALLTDGAVRRGCESYSVRTSGSAECMSVATVNADRWPVAGTDAAQWRRLTAQGGSPPFSIQVANQADATH